MGKRVVVMVAMVVVVLEVVAAVVVVGEEGAVGPELCSCLYLRAWMRALLLIVA